MEQTQSSEETSSDLVGGAFEALRDNVIFPSSPESLGVFYFFWIFIFLMIHIGWDVYTKQTPNFHLRRLEQKPAVLFSAATFASSLIILVSLVSVPVRGLLADNSLPLVLAGFAGVLLSIPSLCPYELPKDDVKDGSED